MQGSRKGPCKTKPGNRLLCADRHRRDAMAKGNEMTHKVYIASSWRNAFYEGAIKEFAKQGFAVWDWRQPPTGNCGFGWPQVDSTYQAGQLVDVWQWQKMLNHPNAQRGFASDLAGMNWCDFGVLLHPCGKSAHLEAGWLAGRGKKVHIICPTNVEPDLMVLALNGHFFKTAREAAQGIAGMFRDGQL